MCKIEHYKLAMGGLVNFGNSTCAQHAHVVKNSAGSESDLGQYDTDPHSGALVLYVMLVE